MQTTQFITLSLVLSAAIFSSTMKAQETETEPARGSQFTFAYPLGTNGSDAINESNKFSFNLLYGVNGGLDGFEIGGLANYNHGEVRGAQLAGLANINKEYTSGLMWAGCINLALDDARGVQFADVNVTKGDFNGLQAGVVNYAGGLRGVQLGVVNIVGEDNGAVPIGLINVVKGGYYALELSTNEVLRTNINYKMGVEHFYTIFKLGYSWDEIESVYSAGLGFGSMLTLAKNHKLSMDLSINQIVYNEEWDVNDNYLSKFDLTYRYHLGEHVSLLAGPSFNWYASKEAMDDGAPILNIPSHAHNFSCEGYQNWMWLGFNAGIAFTF